MGINMIDVLAAGKELEARVPMEKSCKNCIHERICKIRSEIYSAFRKYQGINLGTSEKINVGLPRLLASTCSQFIGVS